MVLAMVTLVVAVDESDPAVALRNPTDLADTFDQHQAYVISSRVLMLTQGLYEKLPLVMR